MKVKVTLTPKYGPPVTEILSIDDVALMFPIFDHEIRMAKSLGQPVNLMAEMNDIKVTIEPYEKEKEDDSGRRKETWGSCESVKSLVRRVKRKIRHRPK